MGHVGSVHGLEVDLRKSKVVKNWPKPLTLIDICSFLAVVGYYRRLAEGFSFIIVPLTAMTKKKAKFEWTDYICC